MQTLPEELPLATDCTQCITILVQNSLLRIRNTILTPDMLPHSGMQWILSVMCLQKQLPELEAKQQTTYKKGDSWATLHSANGQ